MRTKVNGKSTRLELGEHIVADPLICHGKPTFKGTRIMVWQILDQLADGMSPEKIVRAWGSRVSRDAIAETVALARCALLNKHGRLRRPREFILFLGQRERPNRHPPVRSQ